VGTMTRRCAVLGATLMLASCEPEGNEAKKPEQAASQALTAEEAQKALANMLARRDHNLGWLDRLSRDLEKPIEDKGDGKIEIGRWECDLKEKTFRAEVHFPKAHYHRHNFYRGAFKWTRDGWQAKVTDEESAHGGD
jgi:hypothetical protein